MNEELKEDIAWLDYEYQTLPTDDMVSLKFALKSMINNAQGLLRRVDERLHEARKENPPIHGKPGTNRAKRCQNAR